MGEVIYSGESEVRLSFVYKETLDAEQFNQQWANTLKSGVYAYTSPLFTRVSDSSITVEKFTVVVKNDDISYTDSLTASSRTADIAVKVTTKSSQTLTGISDSSPYIVAELWSDLTGVDPSDQNQYQQDEDLSLRIRNVSYDDYDSSKQILLGKCLYRDNVGTRDELYDFDINNSMQKSPLFETETWFDEFIGNVTSGLQVTINGGTLQGASVDDLVLTYNGGGSNPSLPTTGYHRYDLVYVNDANTLTYVSGTEEVNPDDGETRPTQVSLSNYSFPVCHIYVSSDLTGASPYIIEPVDVINIMPRFMRKSVGATSPLPDRLITTQTEFTDYFGTNDGTTYTITDSEHNVYLKARNDDLPYELDHLVEINDDDVRVECLNGAKIKFTAKEAGIKIKDDTHLIIDEYNKNTFEVLSENTYDDDGDQVVLESGDEIFAFSDTPEINRKYTISDIVKNMKEDVRLNVNANPNWFYLNSIDTGGNVGEYSSIAKDSENNIYISYFDNSNGYLKYAKSTDNGSSWATGTIDSTGNVGEYTSIIVDSNDNIYISYHDISNHYLKYAKSTDNGSSWTTGTIDSTGVVGEYTSIIIDSNDNIYISYFDETNDDLKYAKSTDGGSSWTTGTIDSTGAVGTHTSIIVDSNDNIYISYFDDTNDDLKYAKSTDGGSSWTTGAVDSTGIVGRYTSIIVDTNDNIYISYHDATNYDLKYAKSTDGGSSWTTGTIDSTGYVGEYSSLVIDNKDNIYISYHDATNYDLKYAKSTDGGSSWTTGTIDSTGYVGEYTSITIDLNDNIYISYFDNSNDDLKVAKGSYNNSEILNTSDTNIATNLFHCVPFEDSGTNYLFVAYEESTNNISYNVYKYDSTSKQYEVYQTVNNGVDTGLSTVSYIRCSQDGSHVHLVYEDGNGLYHIYESFSNILSGSSFDSNNTNFFEASSDYSSPVVFTNTDRDVYLAYLDDSSSPYRLIFRRNDTSQAIPNTGNNYTFASRVTFDSSPATDLDNNVQHSIIEYGGTVIISFGEDDSGNTNLYCVYSTDDGSNWAKTSLDTTDNCGFSSKLALNPSGTGFADIAIVYDNKTTTDKDTITFAEVDTSGTPSLDNKTDVISETGASFDYIDFLMSDNNQYPLSSDILAQVVGFNSVQRYNSIVDSTGDVLNKNSIAVDSNGYFYISYFDGNLTKLMYAKSLDGGITWSTSEIEDNGGDHSSIDIDSKDNIYISYYDEVIPALRCAKSADGGSSWSVITVDSSFDVGKYTSIFLDTEDTVHISYYDVDNTSLKYAKSTDGGSSWEISTIDSSGNTGQYTSIVVDFEYTVYISYRDASSTSLNFAKLENKGNSWEIKVVDSDGNPGIYSSIVLDSYKNIYISYWDENDSDLRLSKSTDGGGSWTTKILDFVASTGMYTSCTVDSYDNIYISYYNITAQSLMVSKSFDFGNTWINISVDRFVGSTSGQFSSICVDSDDNILISYYDDIDSYLKSSRLLKSVYSAVSIDEGTNWVTRGIYLQENDNQGFLADVFNDYCYLVYYNGDTETGFFEDTNHLLKLFYNFEITVSEDIYPVNNANIIISENFAENIELALNVDADDYGDEDDAEDAVIDMSNSINSKVQLVLENSNHGQGITGDSNFNISKVYNLTMKDILIDESNSISKNIAKISHSTLSSINILKQDGKKNFSDCKNISVIGMIDKKATIGNGDFNE